jgi:hypothetical protein
VADIDLFSGSTMTKRKHGARLTGRMVRKDKRPAPRLGATFELLSPFIDLGLSKGSRIAADRMNSTAWAKQVFQKISKLLGRAEAERIFLALATPLSKKEMEEFKNCELLQFYDDTGWPVQKVAKHLAKANQTLPAAERYGTRGGDDRKLITQQSRIDRQLRRLLKKRGRSLGRPGRPRKKNGSE